MKKLYKSETNKKVSGVAAGTAEYFNMDVSLGRILWFLFILFTGFFPGLLLYVVLAVILPTESEVKIKNVKFSENNEAVED